MGERASISRTTLNKITTKGDPGVSLGNYANVLFVLGMAEQLGDLTDVKTDAVGLELEVERLPQRIRKPHLARRLWVCARKYRASATFEYDASWLSHANRFALEPALTLSPAPFHTTTVKPQFGSVGDSTPGRRGAGTLLQDHRLSFELEI